MAQNQHQYRTVSTRPVKPLPTEVARKIAAGEVIDRPASILREMLDNAVDSGADAITADISGGGIDSVTVTDNGIGMTKEDLAAAAHPHSTSKITSEDDLKALSTLGFRGEALASIAAVSRLEIVSRRRGEDVAWKLAAPLAGSGGNNITPATRTEGTTVKSQALFEDIPARRLFLKRPATETAQCRQIFIEKALPFTDISFRLIADGKTRLDLPAGESLAERFVEAFEMNESPDLFSEITVQDKTLSDDFGDWRITLLLGDPAVSRADKRHLLIYVNGRRVQEYSLLQAIEYGATGFFPNGTHPAAVLFLEINPALVDFNIHPAKKEVRFKDISAVHHAVSTAVRSFYVRQSEEKRDAVMESSWQQTDMGFDGSTSVADDAAYGASRPESEPRSAARSLAEAALNAGNEYAYTSGRPTGTASAFSGSRPTGAAGAYVSGASSTETEYAYTAGRPTGTESAFSTNDSSTTAGCAFTGAASSTPASSAFGAPDETPHVPLDSFKYIGQIMQVFLAVEKDGTLLLIDQHAGHERILYDKFMKGCGRKQPLLIAESFETESDTDDAYLNSLLPALDEAGFSLKQVEAGIWEVTAVPATWQGKAGDLYTALIEKRIEPAELQRTLAAYTACRSAVKEGHYLDEGTGRMLASQILALPDPHCPHGRPLWIALTQDGLYALIKRT
ncbi:MAG: DNA mismatch repair endonuclease MutL [Treponema sp.]|nr:DNA mismatch repair endonuclease MutL [Candidatus Treponema caballi]